MAKEKPPVGGKVSKSGNQVVTSEMRERMEATARVSRKDRRYPVID